MITSSGIANGCMITTKINKTFNVWRHCWPKTPFNRITFVTTIGANVRNLQFIGILAHPFPFHENQSVEKALFSIRTSWMMFTLQNYIKTLFSINFVRDRKQQSERKTTNSNRRSIETVIINNSKFAWQDLNMLTPNTRKKYNEFKYESVSIFDVACEWNGFTMACFLCAATVLHNNYCCCCCHFHLFIIFLRLVKFAVVATCLKCK